MISSCKGSLPSKDIPVMPAILPYGRPAMQIPQSRHVIRRRRHQVRRIRTKRSVPYPSLMPGQDALELVVVILRRPDLDRRIRRTRR